MEEKMELFFNKEIINEALLHGNVKGIPRETLSIFSEPKGRMVLAKLFEDGEYEISPPKISLIPKKHSNEMRKVYVNTPLDRMVLSIINNVYSRLYCNLIHPNCVSYQKGLGVGRIVKNISRQICSSPAVKGYKVDLSKYFDSVNKETLFQALAELNTNSPIDKIVLRYYSDDHIIDEKGNKVNKYKSLAQGCALGAFLANYILRDIDEEISNMNVLYYRYSDDILILGKDADRALTRLNGMLKAKGLTLNPKKIFKLDSNTEFEFLGIKINQEKLSMSDDSIDNYKRKIKEITKFKKGTVRCSRDEQRKAVRRINRYIYTDYIDNPDSFGWLEYFGSVCNSEDNFRLLDEFTKDHIKALYTGKWNHTTNMHKTSNVDLKELGYISLVHMYKLYKINKEVYRSEVQQIM